MFDIIDAISAPFRPEIIGGVIAGGVGLFFVFGIGKFYVGIFQRVINRIYFESLNKKEPIKELNYIIFDEFSSSLENALLPKSANKGKHQKALEAFAEEDYAIAFGIWNNLAKTGDATAQSNLGNLYYRGLGVKQDYAKAVKWSIKAARQGDGTAQNNLGISYHLGQSVEQNYQEAVKWYRKAAEGKSETAKYAQYNLGILYSEGKGVPQSKIHSYMWLSISQANGYENAKDYLEKIYTELSKEGLERAQEKAANWMEQNY